MRSRSTLQLRCILAGHLIGEAGYEGMRGQEASRLMLEWGTASFAKRYPKVPEVAASPSSLPMLPRTAQLSPSELTPLLMTAKPKLEARLLKEAQHELPAAGRDTQQSVSLRPVHGRRRSSQSLPRACCARHGARCGGPTGTSLRPRAPVAAGAKTG
jgi:hypothetical protein